jgi:glycosyltransferase involved in cell wall biosynthesis
VLAWPGAEGESAHPYTVQLCQALEAGPVRVTDLTLRALFRDRFDIVHVHWPEYALPLGSDVRQWGRAALLLVGLRWSRLRGARVVWTVHNLGPHDAGRDRGRLPRAFWALFTGAVDGVIAATRAGLPAIRDRFPALRRTPYSVVPLGHFRGAYDRSVDRDEARDRLGIRPDAAVLAYVGRIRAYKNVPDLVSKFRKLDSDDLVLLVAGSVEEAGLDEELRVAADGDDRVRLHLDFVPDEVIQVFLSAADAVVLPYSRVFNSGSALLALSFARPVLLPDTPTFRELRAVVGEDWVHLFEGELAPEDLRAVLGVVPERGEPSLAAFDWDLVAERTVDFYRRIA